MGNFEYIIASLPDLIEGFTYAPEENFGTVTAEIRSLLDRKDAAELDLFARGLSAENLDADFYKEAQKSRNDFVRAYFEFDLALRNAKVAYLNEALGRDLGTDIVSVSEEELPEPEELPRIKAALADNDILSREKGLDGILSGKIDSLSEFHYFDLTAVLAYLAKLKIVDRWLVLDEEHGRRLFKQLVDEVRGTFKGVNYQE